MVQGLAFLSKKSWHTKNFSNQEKVWMAEERQKAEENKTKELARQIQQEREEEEMNRLAGNKSSKIDRGIDWMYQGHNKDSEIAKEDAKKKSEEYLLGKEFVPQGVPKGDLDDGNANEGVNAVVASASARTETDVAVSAEPTVQERNEAFRMRHEDPMFAVTMRAVQDSKKLEKKKELFEKVYGGTAVDVDKAVSKRESKREKKDKKKKHKAKRRRDHYDSDDSGSYYERKRRHKKSRERHYSRSPSEDRCTRERKRGRSPSRERDEPKHTSRDGNESHRSRQARHNHRERSRSDRDRSRSSSVDRSANRRERESIENRSREPDRNRRERNQSRSPSWDGEPDFGHRRRNRSRSNSRDREESRNRYKNDRYHETHYNQRGQKQQPESRKDASGDSYNAGVDEYGRHRRFRRERSHSFDSYERDRSSEHKQEFYSRPRYNDDRKPPPNIKSVGEGARDSTSRSSRSEHDPRSDEASRQQYGLQGSHRKSSHNDLGPDRTLLLKKREERELQLRKASSTRRSLTAEERAAALKAMEENAKKREVAREELVNKRRDDDHENVPSKSHASFLHDIHRRAHGIDDNNFSMAERLQQNRYSHQKERDSFL